MIPAARVGLIARNDDVRARYHAAADVMPRDAAALMSPCYAKSAKRVAVCLDAAFYDCHCFAEFDISRARHAERAAPPQLIPASP